MKSGLKDGLPRSFTSLNYLKLIYFVTNQNVTDSLEPNEDVLVAMFSEQEQSQKEIARLKKEAEEAVGPAATTELN